MNPKTFLTLCDKYSLTIDHGPLLQHVETDWQDTETGDAVIMRATWLDGDGEQFEERFTVAGVLNAKLEGNTIVLANSNGAATEIRFFETTQVNIELVCKIRLTQ